jgi:hypothetical protein
MKAKTIFTLLTALLLSVVSIQAGGLIESNLLLSPDKACAPRKVAGRPAGQDKPEVPVTAANEVVVKLFNADGQLVGQQSVTMKEFMDGEFTRSCLPAGTTFVMFHGQIAYYQTSTDGAATPGA